MTSILLLIATIYHEHFRCNYVRNKSLFVYFFLRFRNVDEILNISNIDMTLIAYAFSKIRTVKDVVRKMSKKFRL